jgi:dolichol-phosphate mannosyltransferase
MGTLYVFTEFIKFPYFVASLVAIELSILSNFSLNIIWTWKDRKREEPLWTKLIRYHIGVGVTAFFVNYLILIILTEFFGTQYLISNLIGISIGTVSNFVINDLWTFKNPT